MVSSPASIPPRSLFGWPAARARNREAAAGCVDSCDGACAGRADRWPKRFAYSHRSRGRSPRRSSRSDEPEGRRLLRALCDRSAKLDPPWLRAAAIEQFLKQVCPAVLRVAVELDVGRALDVALGCAGEIAVLANELLKLRVGDVGFDNARHHFTSGTMRMSAGALTRTHEAHSGWRSIRLQRLR